ncbi:hypothetical protein L208DRAFT_1425078 [Tricholoma matsutake]|nr:hypothetical protein L208DRAFT_1425078 [Tricholoma matsutake 945]
MTKRIEKRWKALDQPMFILALVLNPFKGISCFGDKANYLSSKGVFKDWEKNKDSFQSGKNPLMMQKTFLTTTSTYKLADFAILLLSISMNQARLECSFSDLKIKKTRLWNRLKLLRLEKMAKVSSVRSSQKEAGYVKEHFLKVLWYADLHEWDGEELSESRSALVKSCEGWRKEMVKWKQEEQARSDNSDEEELWNVTYELLFAGCKESDIDEQLRCVCRQQAYTEEAQLMELLADEEADEDRIPDDGELDGSGDDFNG